MPRTSYDPVLDANRPQSGGLYPAPVRPWWETLAQDPWYITGAKAVLGEREVEGMRRGEVAPWIETVAPLLFMGRGPKGMMEPRIELPPPHPRPQEMPDLRFWHQLSPEEQQRILGQSGKGEAPPIPQRARDAVEKISDIMKEKFPDPTEARRDLLQNNPQEYWKLYSRGLLPGNKNTQMWGNTAFDYGNWNYTGSRPGELIGGGYHSDDPMLQDFTNVPPPYGYQSPLKITPQDIANVPTPPGIVITPEEVGQLPPPTPFTAQEAFNIQKLGLKPPNLSNLEYQKAYDQFIQEQAAQTGDGHQQPGGLFFKNQFPGYQIDYQHGIGPQPEVPARFLPPAPDPTPPPTFDFGEFGYIYPQMPFYPQTDWYRSLRDVQSYPGENAYAIV
jgi:hypothetical protein